MAVRVYLKKYDDEGTGSAGPFRNESVSIVDEGPNRKQNRPDRMNTLVPPRSLIKTDLSQHHHKLCQAT